MSSTRLSTTSKESPILGRSELAVPTTSLGRRRSFTGDESAKSSLSPSKSQTLSTKSSQSSLALKSGTSINNLKADKAHVGELMSGVDQMLKQAQINLVSSDTSLDSLNEKEPGRHPMVIMVGGDDGVESNVDDMEREAIRSKSSLLFGDDGDANGSVVFLISEDIPAAAENSAVGSAISLNESNDQSETSSLPRITKPSAKEVTQRLTDKSKFPASYQAKLEPKEGIKTSKSSDLLSNQTSRSNNEVFERLSKSGKPSAAVVNDIPDQGKKAKQVPQKEKIEFFNTAQVAIP